jgi:hypothetical protein
MTGHVRHLATQAVGAIGVIQKPFDPMTLPGEIKRIMDARPL